MHTQAPKKIVYKAPAKVNIFLKIVGWEAGYHLINSRFMRVDSLYDSIWFEPSDAGRFEIVGEFDCPMEDNTIYKAYKALMTAHPHKEALRFLKTHRVVVYKNIPAFAGLGGGSSNAATFLMMVNKTLEMGLTMEEMMEVGKSVGADVPFFLSGQTSANVTGIGDIIQGFDEAPLDLEFIFPEGIKCSTAEVYRNFRKNYAKAMPKFAEDAEKLATLPSRKILQEFAPEFLNDLYPAALKLCPELYEYKDPEHFFSGSGSTHFKVKT